MDASPGIALAKSAKPAKPPLSSLLALPVEISTEIFKLAVCSGTGFHVKATHWSGKPDRETAQWDGWTMGVADEDRATGDILWKVVPQQSSPISLLLVCRQTNIQTTKLLYSHNHFRFTIDKHLYGKAQANDFARYMLQRLPAASRNWIQTLHLDCIRCDPLGSGDVPPSSRRLAPPSTLEEFCVVVKTMTGLKELGLGIWASDGVKYDYRHIRELRSMAPLFDLCRPPPHGTQARIVLWLWWPDWEASAKDDRDELFFMGKLVEFMRQRRAPLDSASGGAGESIVFLDPWTIYILPLFKCRS